MLTFFPGRNASKSVVPQKLFYGILFARPREHIMKSSKKWKVPYFFALGERIYIGR